MRKCLRTGEKVSFVKYSKYKWEKDFGAEIGKEYIIDSLGRSTPTMIGLHEEKPNGREFYCWAYQIQSTTTTNCKKCRERIECLTEDNNFKIK